MNPAEVGYTFRTPYPDMLALARAQNVQMPVYYAGALVAPTASGSSFSLIKPDGTTLIDARAITISGSVATCALTAGDFPAATATLGEGYQEVWVLVLADGTTRTVDREAALAKRPLVPCVTDADLIEAYPTLNTILGSSLTSWQVFIDAAWKEIIGRIIGEGHLPYLIKSGWSFRVAHIELSLANLFRAQALAQARGNFLELSREHRTNYGAAWGRINFRTDDDHDGRVDDNTKRRGEGGAVVHINGSPEYATARDARW